MIEMHNLSGLAIGLLSILAMSGVSALGAWLVTASFTPSQKRKAEAKHRRKVQAMVDEAYRSTDPRAKKAGFDVNRVVVRMMITCAALMLTACGEKTADAAPTVGVWEWPQQLFVLLGELDAVQAWVVLLGGLTALVLGTGHLIRFYAALAFDDGWIARQEGMIFPGKVSGGVTYDEYGDAVTTRRKTSRLVRD